MKYYKASLPGNNTVMTFIGPESTIIGIITDVSGRVVSQVLNPKMHPPTDDPLPEGHQMIKIGGRGFIAATLAESLTIKQYLETVNPKLCSPDMLEHLQNISRRVQKNAYDAAQNPSLN